MIEGLFCRKSLRDVLYDQTLQKVLGLFGMLRERLVLEVEFSLDDITNNFQLRVTREWDLTTKHDVEDDSHRPNVDLLVVVLQEDLGRNIVRLKFKITILMCSDLPNHSSSSSILCR